MISCKVVRILTGCWEKLEMTPLQVVWMQILLTVEDGLDTLDYRDSDTGVSVNLADNTATGGHAQGDNISNIENILGSAFADNLTGNAGVNIIAGGPGSRHAGWWWG